jgi:hypothetical protein
VLQEIKGINRKSLCKVQEQNLEEKLDKLFDISACICKLPSRPCDDNAVKCKKENCQTQHIICTCSPSKKVPLEEREYLRDQRAKTTPKGSFQLGSVDKAAVKRDKRVETEAERLQSQIQKQQEVDLANFASTSSQYDSFESISGESEEPSGGEAEEFKPSRQPSGAYSFLKTPR